MKISKVILVASFLMVQYGYSNELKFTNEYGIVETFPNATVATFEEALENAEEAVSSLHESIQAESKKWEAEHSKDNVNGDGN
jgi:hypothetical protein